jgi:hypothetical protein
MIARIWLLSEIWHVLNELASLATASKAVDTEAESVFAIMALMAILAMS